MLQAHGVELLIDIRTVPRSCHNPQFNFDSLPQSLKQARIGYMPMKELGGLRHARPDSINTGWNNSSFRGFADYMQTEDFEHGLEKLIEAASEPAKAARAPSGSSAIRPARSVLRAAAQKKRVAIMCAEAVPWRCHRSLIADALSARGIEVRHIMSAAKASPHALTPFARVRAKRVTYPAPLLAED